MFFIHVKTELIRFLFNASLLNFYTLSTIFPQKNHKKNGRSRFILFYEEHFSVFW